jgi:hypothetical protein
MGAGASLPETLDRTAAREAAGDAFDDAAFDAAADNGVISRAAFLAAAERANAAAAQALSAASAPALEVDPLEDRIAAPIVFTYDGEVIAQRVRQCVANGDSTLALPVVTELSAALLDIPSLTEVSVAEHAFLHHLLLSAHATALLTHGFAHVRGILQDELRMRRAHYETIGAAEQHALVASVVNCCTSQAKARVGINLRSIFAGEVSSLNLFGRLENDVPPSLERLGQLSELSVAAGPRTVAFPMRC